MKLFKITADANATWYMASNSLNQLSTMMTTASLTKIIKVEPLTDVDKLGTTPNKLYLLSYNAKGVPSIKYYAISTINNLNNIINQLELDVDNQFKSLELITDTNLYIQ